MAIAVLLEIQEKIDAIHTAVKDLSQQVALLGLARCVFSVSLRPLAHFNNYLADGVSIASEKVLALAASYFCDKFELENTRFAKVVKKVSLVVKLDYVAVFFFFRYLPVSSIGFVKIIREEVPFILSIFFKDISSKKRLLNIFLICINTFIQKKVQELENGAASALEI
jgi:hypothetical protein